MSEHNIDHVVEDENNKKVQTKKEQPLTRSRARRLGITYNESQNPKTFLVKRRPLADDTKVKGNTNVEHRGVLQPKNKDETARKKTTADAKQEHKNDVEYEERYACMPVAEIDEKYSDNPQYASKLASSVYQFLTKFERTKIKDDGLVLQPAKDYLDLREYRTRAVNWIFNRGLALRVPTDTLLLAVYYFDRFLEGYTGADVSCITVAATALHLASKFEDVEPLYLDQILRTHSMRSIKESEVLNLEATFFELLQVFMGPTVTAFATRFIHAVGRETYPAEGYMTRYLCALSITYFPFTKHYYSKIATAAVFIAHNKYSMGENILNPVYEYPAALEKHSGYKLSEIEEIVLELVDLVRKTELMAASSTRKTSSEIGTYSIYKRYSSVGVTSANTIPDFKPFFDAHRAAVAAAATEIGPTKETSDDEPSNLESHSNKNACSSDEEDDKKEENFPASEKKALAESDDDSKTDTTSSKEN